MGLRICFILTTVRELFRKVRQSLRKSNYGSDFKVFRWVFLQEHTWMSETGRHKAKSSKASRSVTCVYTVSFSLFYRYLEAGMLMFTFSYCFLSNPALFVLKTNLEFLHFKILYYSMEKIRWDWRENNFVSSIFSFSLPVWHVNKVFNILSFEICNFETTAMWLWNHKV